MASPAHLRSALAFALARRAGRLHDTSLVIVGDHGEGFEEHGGLQRGLAQFLGQQLERQGREHHRRGGCGHLCVKRRNRNFRALPVGGSHVGRIPGGEP